MNNSANGRQAIALWPEAGLIMTVRRHYPQDFSGEVRSLHLLWIGRKCIVQQLKGH